MENETAPVSTAMPNPPMVEPEMPAPVIPAQAPSSAKRSAPSTRFLNVLLGGALVLAVAGIGFAAGRFTAPATSGFISANGPNGRPGGGFNITPGDGKGGQGGPISIGGSGGPSIEGTVESVTDTTLTIKTADGQTIQIALDNSTTYHAQTDASSDDVATGGKVLVRLNFRAPDGGNVSGPLAGDVTVVP